MSETDAGEGPVERPVSPRTNERHGYPTELIAKTKYELLLFERVSAETSAKLVSAVERLRADIERHTPPPAWLDCGA